MAKTSRTPQPKPDPWADAVAHLRGVDGEWASLIDRVGPCQIRPRKDRFSTLVRAIVGQQISTKAAESIDARLRALVGYPYTPEGVLAAGETALRSVGLSGVKARYALNLAEAVRSKSVPLHKFHRWDDDAIVASLTSIKGIGVWTAEMFLIFSLGRPDVFPVGDLGIRVAIRDRLGLSDFPKLEVYRSVAEPWRPFRSVASWYLWRSLEPAFRASDTPAP